MCLEAICPSPVTGNALQRTPRLCAVVSVLWCLCCGMASRGCRPVGTTACKSGKRCFHSTCAPCRVRYRRFENSGSSVTMHRQQQHDETLLSLHHSAGVYTPIEQAAGMAFCHVYSAGDSAGRHAHLIGMRRLQSRSTCMSSTAPHVTAQM